MTTETHTLTSSANPDTGAVSLHDTAHSYGLVSRLNHWLGAALVLVLLGIGLYFEDMPKGDVKLYWLKLHIAIGTLAFLPLAFRVLWRKFSRGPSAFEQPVVMQRLTQLVHIVLLLGISVLIVTGPLAVWTGGRAIEVFTWFSIPSPTGKMESLHEILEEVHVFTSKAVLIAVILHVLGAVKHLVFERPKLAGRMIGRKRG